MSAKPIAFFTADFPDDFVIEGRRIVLFGGKQVAEVVRGLLMEVGCDASTLMDGKAKGWGFTLDFRGRGFWCSVRSYFPGYYLVLADLEAGSRRGLAKEPLYRELWAELDAAIRRDRRFHDLSWHFTFEEAPPPPDEWWGWAHVRKPPGLAARWLARPIGGGLALLAFVDLLDFAHPNPVPGVGAALASGVLLSIGYRISHVFGVRLPWVRIPVGARLPKA